MPADAARPDALSHFTPHVGALRRCWHCHHFVALLYAGSAARCGRPGGAPVQAAPASGCAFWQREPGADDEPDHVPAAAASGTSGGCRQKP